MVSGTFNKLLEPDSPDWGQVMLQQTVQFGVETCGSLLWCEIYDTGFTVYGVYAGGLSGWGMCLTPTRYWTGDCCQCLPTKQGISPGNAQAHSSRWSTEFVIKVYPCYKSWNAENALDFDSTREEQRYVTVPDHVTGIGGQVVNAFSIGHMLLFKFDSRRFPPGKIDRFVRDWNANRRKFVLWQISKIFLTEG